MSIDTFLVDRDSINLEEGEEMRVKLILALLMLAALAMPAGADPCGDYGMPCCPDATGVPTICNEGECGRGGMCIHCGYIGEPACIHGDTPCKDSNCEVVGGFCRQIIDDCGHVGYAPCEWDGKLVCSYGVLGNDICLACGDYEQPCCQYTDYPCDYGECTNPNYPHVGGICKRNLTKDKDVDTLTIACMALSRQNFMSV
ncbi:MAG: hypothetical protein PHN90_09915 [Methanothrix sp.]|nr:hypothetical protein [Methanothrix sp.]MDD5769019.1 hypothetical protein [Methanothrix sp.]